MYVCIKSEVFFIEPFLRFGLKGEEANAWLNSTKNPGKWSGNASEESAIIRRRRRCGKEEMRTLEQIRYYCIIIISLTKKTKKGKPAPAPAPAPPIRVCRHSVTEMA